jgi:hypothetical protein
MGPIAAIGAAYRKYFNFSVWRPAAVVWAGTALLLVVAAIALFVDTTREPSYGPAGREFMSTVSAIIGVVGLSLAVVAARLLRRHHGPVQHHRSGIAGAVLILIGLVGMVWLLLGHLEPSLTWVVVSGLIAGGILVVRSEVATDHATRRAMRDK